MAYITTQNSFNWLEVNGRLTRSAVERNLSGLEGVSVCVRERQRVHVCAASAAHLHRTGVLITLSHTYAHNDPCGGWISPLYSCRWGKARATHLIHPIATQHCVSACFTPITQSYHFQHLPAPVHGSTEASTYVGWKNTNLSHPSPL